MVDSTIDSSVYDCGSKDVTFEVSTDGGTTWVDSSTIAEFDRPSVGVFETSSPSVA